MPVYFPGSGLPAGVKALGVKTTSDGGVVTGIQPPSVMDYLAANLGGGGGGYGTFVLPTWADLADCTSQIQALINAAENLTGTSFIQIPNGAGEKPYVVGPLVMRQGVYLVGMGGKLKAKGALPALSKIIDFTGVSRAGILGHLEIDGNKAEQTTGIGVPGQNETGQDGVNVINIGPGAADIYLESLYIENAGMEGLYIGPSGTAPKNIRVGSIVVHGANRNGIGITNCDGFDFGYVETRFSGLGPTAALPKDGIDIEPNLTSDIIRGRIRKLVTHDNVVGGASIIGQILGAEPFLVHGPVLIDEFIAYNNPVYGLQTHKVAHLTIRGGEIYNNAKSGLTINRDCRYLRVNDVLIHDNGERGINAALNQQDFASYDWNFDGCRLYNNGKSAANTLDGVRFDSDSASYVLRKVRANGIATYDNQGAMTQRYGWSTGTNVAELDMKGDFSACATGTYLNGSTSSYVESERRAVAATVNPGSISAGADLNVFVSVPGISSSWRVESATPLSGLEPGIIIASIHAATDNIVVRLANITAAAIDPASKTWNFTLSKP